jgi:hypothetical protein
MSVRGGGKEKSGGWIHMQWESERERECVCVCARARVCERGSDGTREGEKDKLRKEKRTYVLTQHSDLRLEGFRRRARVSEPEYIELIEQSIMINKDR